MKQLIILIAFLVTGHFLQAQFYAEVGTRYLIESLTSEENVETPTALSAEAGVGYFFTEKASVKLSGERYWYKPFESLQDLTFWDIKMTITYRLIDARAVKVYGGTGIGYFWQKLDKSDFTFPEESDGDDFVTIQKDNYFGWFPTAGVRIPMGSEKFMLNVAGSYYFHPDKKGRVEGWYNVKAGVNYHW